ncbi:MAG TPA: glutamate--cysteine ligase, partial [Gammaproteobacteria bacterium]|nr:glutamate--cysteine ligase [Gammaproteobacteria bacterium]
LNELQTFVYQQLENEFLWATSMPCVIGGEQSIRIAEYGSSNIGRMKNVYRRGLGHRYGKTMQVIAGVHFNYSYPDSFWAHYREALESQTALADFKNQHYFALTRNLLRFSWLIPYLFGASPAVCKSFFGGKETNLKEYDQHTYYEPYATSLRVADIGYQNNLEEDAGLYVD